MTRPLDDNQLQTLLGLAHDAECLDAGTPVGAERSPARAGARFALLAASIVLVAGLTALWVLIPGSPTSVAHHTSVPPRPTGGTEPNPAPRDGAVVLAIVQSDTGELRCVRWSPPQWSGRSLRDVTNEELQSVGLSMVCDNLAQRLLVVGMEGPAAKLPASDQSAMQMAQCVLMAPGCGVGVFDPQVCRATGCVPGDVSVRVESVALATR